jgi:uncharacterized protein
MNQRLKRLLPTPEALRRKRWLRWLGPALHHPRLWHMSRRGMALGMALGVFFGLLVPIAQIPLAAGAAIVMRANVPAAVASTLVTNPVTFGPVYYAAWRLGNGILDHPVGEGEARLLHTSEPATTPDEGWFSTLTRGVLGVGAPLMLGLATLAIAAGGATYALVSWLWYVKVVLSRKRRQRRGRVGGAH